MTVRLLRSLCGQLPAVAPPPGAPVQGAAAAAAAVQAPATAAATGASSSTGGHGPRPTAGGATSDGADAEDTAGADPPELQPCAGKAEGAAAEVKSETGGGAKESDEKELIEEVPAPMEVEPPSENFPLGKRPRSGLCPMTMPSRRTTEAVRGARDPGSRRTMTRMIFSEPRAEIEQAGYVHPSCSFAYQSHSRCADARCGSGALERGKAVVFQGELGGTTLAVVPLVL